MDDDSLTAERIFERYFLPLYPPDARADLEGARRTDANPGKNPSVLAQIDEAAAIFARLGPAALGAPELVLGQAVVGPQLLLLFEAEPIGVGPANGGVGTMRAGWIRAAVG